LKVFQVLQNNDFKGEIIIISKKLKLLMVGLIVASAFSISTSSLAANSTGDDVPFSFYIPATDGSWSGKEWANGYSSTRSRTTAEKNAQWYMNFGYSSEGAGTIMTMWLDKSGTVYSEPKPRYEGKTYTTSVSKAVSGSVRIGAENNNYTTKTFTVSGSWDPAVY
jgi:hypothetical protein